MPHIRLWLLDVIDLGFTETKWVDKSTSISLEEVPLWRKGGLMTWLLWRDICVNHVNILPHYAYQLQASVDRISYMNIIQHFIKYFFPENSINNSLSIHWNINKANLRDLIAATGLVISNWIQIVNFSACVTVKFDGWPCNTIGHLFYATSSFVHHFVAIGEFKLQLQSGNAQSGSNSTIFRGVRPWNLMDDLAKQ